jgi:hypothetical protein
VVRVGGEIGGRVMFDVVVELKDRKDKKSDPLDDPTQKGKPSRAR